MQEKIFEPSVRASLRYDLMKLSLSSCIGPAIFVSTKLSEQLINETGKTGGSDRHHLQLLPAKYVRAWQVCELDLPCITYACLLLIPIMQTIIFACSHHLSWHSDNEPVYGQTPTVGTCPKILLPCQWIFFNRMSEVTHNMPCMRSGGCLRTLRYGISQVPR